MISIFTNFFITQLIWSITVGLPHVMINAVLLFLLLKLWDHLKIIQALLLSLFLSIGSFFLFIGMVGSIIWISNVTYVMPTSPYPHSTDFLATTLALAGFYVALQSLMVIAIGYWKPLNIKRIFLCIVCSNFVAALLVYKLAIIKYK